MRNPGRRKACPGVDRFSRACRTLNFRGARPGENARWLLCVAMETRLGGVSVSPVVVEISARRRQTKPSQGTPMTRAAQHEAIASLGNRTGFGAGVKRSQRRLRNRIGLGAGAKRSQWRLRNRTVEALRAGAKRSQGGIGDRISWYYAPAQNEANGCLGKMVAGDARAGAKRSHCACRGRHVPADERSQMGRRRIHTQGPHVARVAETGAVRAETRGPCRPTNEATVVGERGSKDDATDSRLTSSQASSVAWRWSP
jgi:hypothetical protein